MRLQPLIFRRKCLLSLATLASLICTAYLFTDKSSSDFTNGDLYKLSSLDLEAFFRYKEKQYLQRRERIARYCTAMENVDTYQDNYNFTRHVLRNAFSYDPRDSVAYCQIAKVGSTTWSRHFIALANPPKAKVHYWKDAVQLFAPYLWPLPHVEEEDLPELLEGFTSLVMVRNPFSRLVSVYFQKLIDLGKGSWARFNKKVMMDFRGGEKGLQKSWKWKGENPGVTFKFQGDDPYYPSPQEFVRYLIKDLTSHHMEMVDQHFRPQHCGCPFCLVNFTVYGRLEDMYEDAAYFFQKSGLSGKVDDVLLKRNPSLSGGRNKEKEFWSRVNDKYVRKLYRALELDFAMFGYSVREYFEEVGLPDKVRGDAWGDSSSE